MIYNKETILNQLEITSPSLTKLFIEFYSGLGHYNQNKELNKTEVTEKLPSKGIIFNIQDDLKGS